LSEKLVHKSSITRYECYLLNSLWSQCYAFRVDLLILSYIAEAGLRSTAIGG